MTMPFGSLVTSPVSDQVMFSPVSPLTVRPPVNWATSASQISEAELEPSKVPAAYSAA